MMEITVIIEQIALDQSTILSSYNWADEVICLSVDETLQQAFEKSIQNARNDWILLIKESEYLANEMIEALPEFLDGTRSHYFQFNAKWLNQPLCHCNANFWSPIRLLNRQTIHFEKSILPFDVRTKDKPAKFPYPIHVNLDRTIEEYVHLLHQNSMICGLGLSNSTRAIGIRTILLEPVRRFVKSYFIRQGYRDGMAGYIVCMFDAYFVFISHIKAWYQDKI